MLHTESSNGWGGQEIRILEESLRFQEKGYRVLLAGTCDSELGRQAKSVKLPFYPISFRFCADPQGILQVRQLISVENVDIVHTHSGKDSWTAGIAAYLSRVPMVRSRHLSTLVKKHWTSKVIYDKLTRFVIASGEDIRNHLIHRNNIPPGKVVSVPAGVDLNKFHPDIDERSFIKEFDLAHFSPLIGVVGVLRSWKGHDCFLDSIQTLQNQFPRALYMFIGDGPRKTHLMSRIKELNLEKKVLITGHRHDIPQIMKALDIVVLPSYANEATSQVLPQALAMSTPVIGTKVGGIPQIIEDGVTGLLVPPNDSEALSQALTWMIEHPEDALQMARQGRGKLLKGFTFDDQIQTTEKVYKTILKAR
ncbi:MAG: glycosyltransferase family 4 protein [Deltaproteobacteria bacterium]|nr:glycosyltransferase family 4 protein [Deltaproteobacteria bacterium]